MKTIMLNFPFIKENISPSVIALGCFDGVHLAHEKLIDITIQLAKEKGIDSAVMTFDPHPENVIFNKKVDQLMPFAEKQKKLEQLGVDTLYVIHFNREVSKLRPKEFVQQFLVQLKAQHIVVGFDFTYGFKAEGNVKTLISDGNYTFNLTVLSELKNEGEKIGSTQIRKLVKDGFVEQIPNFLGEYYKTRVFVTSFENNTLMEVAAYEDYQVPLYGDYLVNVRINNTDYQGIVTKTSYFNRFNLEINRYMGPPKNTFTISWLKQIETIESTMLALT